MVEARNPFDARTVLLVLAAGIVAFVLFLLATAFAPQWRQSSTGGASAVSRSAIGFSGLFSVLHDLDGDGVAIATSRDAWSTPGLLVVTPAVDADPDALAALIEARAGETLERATTLIVLPKWLTAPDMNHRGWVMNAGVLPPAALEGLLKPLGVVLDAGPVPPHTRLRDDAGDVDVAMPESPRWLTRGVVPVVGDGNGRIVVGRLENNGGPDIFVLADPDLLSNRAMKPLAGAATAVAIVDWLRPRERAVMFDDLTRTAGSNRNLLRLMFEPPFLAFTIVLIVAALMVGWHALTRFGPPLAEGRAIPFGKRALVDTAAMLVARARREHRLGERYVVVVRDAVAAALGATHLPPDDLEAWLGRLPGGYAQLAHAARTATDAASMQRAAAALYQWKKDVTRDH